jgi:hypothetical protein
MQSYYKAISIATGSAKLLAQQHMTAKTLLLIRNSRGENSRGEN